MSTRVSTYERIAASLIRSQPRPRRIARFENGRLLIGTASLHRTEASRRWRLFWRLKYNRKTREES